jgi:hypothetical protein
LAGAACGFVAGSASGTTVFVAFAAAAGGVAVYELIGATVSRPPRAVAAEVLWSSPVIAVSIALGGIWAESGAAGAVTFGAGMACALAAVAWTAAPP